MRWGLAILLCAACGSTYGSAPSGTGVDAGTDGAAPPSDGGTGTASDGGPSDGAGPCDPGTVVQGLVAYYPLDEAQGAAIKDCSGKGHDGQILRLGATTWTTGKRGGAVRVASPDGCMDFGTGPEFRFPGAFTAMAWVNVVAFPASGNEAILGRSTDLVVDGWRLDSTITTELGAAVATSGGQPLFVGREDQPTNKWVHLTVTFVPNGKLQAFIDGVPSATTTWGGVLAEAQATPFRIGCRGDNGGFFNGSVDEVRIYDRELTSTEIAILSAP